MRIARTVTRGVRVYTCSVVVGPTHPICSMIYGSTGATHFDQLAKIFTGYEITGARSSGIFMGILFIAVGFLFKITAVPFRVAVGRTAAYRWLGRVGGTALIAANLPNRARAGLRARETHHYLVRALRP